MRTPRTSFRTIVAVAVAGVTLAACDGSGGEIASPDLGTETTRPTTPDPSSPGAAPSSDEPASDGSPAATTPPTDATLPPPVTPVSVVEVPEVGVPGLDSDDAFCASWSRFAGSFQVVAVTAAFGSGPPEQLAALEVAAAPTVTTAYEQMVANWPDELSSEADLVADEYLGPFARRSSVAFEALRDVGADDAEIDAIADAWLAGLAGRDTSTPEFAIDLPDPLWSVIDDAAATFAGKRVPFSSDPSLVTNVEAPLTLEYISVACPDQGTLSGQEIDTP